MGSRRNSGSFRSLRVTRAIAPEECAAIGSLPLPVDWSRVRLYRAECPRGSRLARRLVLWLSRGRAVALGNHVFLPARCERDVGVLAHEMTHCAQYQAWGPVRYFGKAAVAQTRDFFYRRFGLGRSPYAYVPDPALPFAAYGMEQQAQIVEDAWRGSAAARAITESCAPAM